MLNFNLDSLKLFNAYHLKLIALATMIIDHLGALFYPDLYFLRIIGRVSFILYAFMLTEGFIHTRNISSYITKLTIWTFLSEIPFDFAFYGKLVYWEHQNIFFSLLISILGLLSFKLKINFLIKIFIGIFCCFFAYFIKADYSWYGVLLVFFFYFLRQYPVLTVFSIETISMIASFKIFTLQFFAFLGFIPIMLYNGERGKKIGNIYYSFYAIHLLIFGTIKYSIT